MSDLHELKSLRMQTAVLRITVSILLTILTIEVSAQSICTRLYKRVLIVENGQKLQTNDDAHYLTFTKKGMYESDKDGNSVGGQLIEFIRDNHSFHCYCGVGYYGYADYFFLSDYSRINIKISNSITYVYQQVLKSTNASFRTVNNQNNNSKPNNTPVIINYPNNQQIPPANTPSRTLRREKCTMCNGTGVGANQIKYSHSYTGNDPKSWCQECGKYGYTHYHVKTRCGKCGGKGYVERYY